MKLLPTDPAEKLNMQNKELNHGRLAMIAVMGIFLQEYLTGYPALESLKLWISSDLPLIQFKNIGIRYVWDM